MISYIDARKKCTVLKGKRIQYINRCLNLIDIGFGDVHKKMDRNGKLRNVASYAIHIQCPFRISNRDKILTGSEDFYVSSSEGNYIDLDDRGRSVFDDIIDQNSTLLKKETVINIEINKFGDLLVECQNICISVFVTGMNDCEAWRFFEIGKGEKHLVVSGKGFEFQ